MAGGSRSASAPSLQHGKAVPRGTPSTARTGASHYSKTTLSGTATPRSLVTATPRTARSDVTATPRTARSTTPRSTARDSAYSRSEISATPRTARSERTAPMTTERSGGATPRSARSTSTTSGPSRSQSGGYPKVVSPAVKHLKHPGARRSSSGSSLASKQSWAEGERPAGMQSKEVYATKNMFFMSLNHNSGEQFRNKPANATNNNSSHVGGAINSTLDFASHHETNEFAGRHPGRRPENSSKVGMAISPKESDPPPSGRVYGAHGRPLELNRKKKGMFSDGCSAETTHHIEKTNPSIFHKTTTRRFVTPDFNGSAGMNSMDLDPKGKKSGARTANTYDSSQILDAIDDSRVNESFQAVRDHRDQHDKHFIDICNYTGEHKKEVSRNGQTIKSMLGAHESSGVADLLLHEGW